jgi:hypothetical protein
MRIAGLLFASALLFGACTGGDRGEETPTPGFGPFPTPGEPIDLATVDWATLVHWEGFSYLNEPPPAEADRLFAALVASTDERYLPFLLDLAVIPGPYGERAREILHERLGPHTAFPVFGWIEDRGFQRPEDDPPGYVEFKHLLFATVQEQMAAFIDPGAGRLISAQEILWGGVKVDGIPPLEEPRFVTPAEAAEWLDVAEPVIGVEVNGDARAYPLRIIDWHEMVNDTVGGVPVSLAYCTLCGSAILYDGRVGDRVFRFGTSGMLYRSNKLMYDRQTRSLWEQYTGEPVWGELVGSGVQLKILPVTHATYGQWLKDHPQTKVLDIRTGFPRDYTPGAAYGHYFNSEQLMFPAPNREGGLHPKSVVYTVRLGGETVAYPIRTLASAGFIVDTVSGRRLVVVATEDGLGGRAYLAGDREFVRYDARERVIEDASGGRWVLTEAALEGPGGALLERVPGHNSFWFAVANHAAEFRLWE